MAVVGDDVLLRVTAVLLILQGGDARFTLDPLQLEPVVDAGSGEQRLVLALVECPTQAEVDILVEVLHDYGWRMLAGGRPQLKTVRWPRLLDCLSGGHSGPPVLAPAAAWDRAPWSLLSSAIVRALVNALHSCHEACSDVRQDLWSQRCEGGCVRSRSVLPLLCSGCGIMAPVWVHRCASFPLCEPCRERASRGWPKARWALRQSGKMSSSACKVIRRDLQEVQVDGVRSPDVPPLYFPCLYGGRRWTVTLGSYGCGITGEA